MRPGQHNKRGRNRNRHRGGGGGGGGNSANKVFDSNGPDVKLRGTAQTVAEKYLQLGRDAQASGDIVMAESYYQFADHYYRVWLSAQPAGQPIQFSRRMGEEEGDEEVTDAPAEGEEDSQNEAGGEAGSVPEGAMADGERPREGQHDEGQQQSFHNRPRRDFQPRDGNREQNRDGGNRYRNRWGRRNDRFGNDGGHTAEGDGSDRQERQDYQDRGLRGEREFRQGHENGGVGGQADDGGNWEAPSFLKRPAPAVPAEAGADDAPQDRGNRGRRARGEAPSEEAPQGE
jgi:hypothetical protein